MERDYFHVTAKPCSNIANEQIIFEDQDDDALGESVSSNWVPLNPANTTHIAPYKKDGTDPTTLLQHNQPQRPGTAATEIYDFTRPQRVQTPQSRPSTSMGLQSLRLRQTQIWGDAGRIAALTGGKDSVDRIRKVLDKMHSKTGDHVENLQDTPYDQVRPVSRAGSSLRRDVNAEKKTGVVPRDISADEARQLMASRSHSLVQRGPAVQERSPHQPNGPVSRQSNSDSKHLKPLRAMPAAFRGVLHRSIQAGTTGNNAAGHPIGATPSGHPIAGTSSNAAQSYSHAGKAKPKPSSLFLMSVGPAKSKGAASGVQSVGGGARKSCIGVESSRTIANRVSQTLTLAAPSS